MALLNMPSFEYPSNALVNFKPINDAIDTYRDERQRSQQNALAQRRIGMDEERLGMQRQQVADQREEAVRRRIGGQALLALNEPDEAKRGQALQQIIAMHPNAASLPPQYHDPRTGLLHIVGDAGMADDYLKMQLQRNADQRAAAAEGRASAMAPVQLEGAKIDLATKRREFENPADRIEKVKEDEQLYRVPKRPGEPAQPLVAGQGGGKPPPEHTAKSANFAGRMIEAERNIRGILNGEDPISGTPRAKFSATDKLNVVPNAMPEGVRNMMISGEHQQYRQAAEQWIRAFLRKESGAAIGKDEFARDFVVYFPQPGDDPGTVTQKEAARAAVMQGMAGEAGAYFGKANPEGAKHLETYRSGGKPNNSGWSVRKLD